MTEEAIVTGCNKNQPQAQKALYDRLAHRMMGVCIRYAKNREEAEDIFQEAFVRVFKYIGSLEKPKALDAWAKRIFINTAINFYQKHSRHHGHFDVDQSFDLSDQAADAISTLSNEELLRLVAGLPDGYRVVFNLYVMEGYSHKEIGEQLGISEGTSKSQLSRAKNLLKKQIMQLEPLGHGQ